MSASIPELTAGDRSPGESAAPWKVPARVAVGVILIALAALVVYWPALDGGFILDDDILLTQNSLIKAPDGLYRFWFTTEPLDYWPVSNTSFWLEWRLWGENPTGYHVTNLVLHIAASLLVWVILRELAVPGAWLAAMLFTVHPVNVESVAWISQRKNTLSIVFFLLSILWYLKSQHHDRPARQPSYWLALLAFLLAMLSKGSVATLPLMLPLLTWWQRGRVTRQDLLRLLPFFVVAAVLTGVNIWFQRHGADTEFRIAAPLERLLGAGAIVWFYLLKALVPLNLMFFYPQWDIRADDWRWWIPLLAAIALTAALIWQRRRWWVRPLLVAWALFCLALLPVMGLTDIAYMKHSLVADHYQHLAIIAVLALVAAAAATLYQRFPGQLRTAALGLAMPFVAGLAFLAREQSRIYASAIDLYEISLKQNPDSWLAHTNLALLLLEEDPPLRAEEHCKAALALNPALPQAHNTLGLALVKMGFRGDAIREFQKAVEIKPDYANAHHNLGLALTRNRQPAQAIEHFRLAIASNPDHFEARNTLGTLLAQSRQLPEAIEQLEIALRLKPDDAGVHNNLANALAASGKLEEAISHYQQAVQLKPDHLRAQANLAGTYADAGRLPEAVTAAERALELARAADDETLAHAIERQLNSYRAALNRNTGGGASRPSP